jgi:hypothetical protein
MSSNWKIWRDNPRFLVRQTFHNFIVSSFLRCTGKQVTKNPSQYPLFNLWNGKDMPMTWIHHIRPWSILCESVSKWLTWKKPKIWRLDDDLKTNKSTMRRELPVERNCQQIRWLRLWQPIAVHFLKSFEEFIDMKFDKQR